MKIDVQRCKVHAVPFQCLRCSLRDVSRWNLGAVAALGFEISWATSHSPRPWLPADMTFFTNLLTNLVFFGGKPDRCGACCMQLQRAPKHARRTRRRVPDVRAGLMRQMSATANARFVSPWED